jgi:hypothetical protein
MATDAQGRIVEFQEKPANPKPCPGVEDRALVSMGIYVFDADFLAAELERDARDPSSSHDFGKDLIPRLLAQGRRLVAHRFADSCVNMVGDRPYWRDVGTPRRLLGGQPRPHPCGAGAQSVRRPMADPQPADAAAAGQVRVRQRRAARRRARFPGLQRLHRQRLDGAALDPVLQGAGRGTTA